MRIIEQKIYNYQDLLLPENSSLKDRVISELSDINVNYDDWYQDDIFKEQCKEKGFNLETLYFSGFYSHGDGAMFEGYIKLDKETESSILESYVKNQRLVRLIKLGLITVSCSFEQYGHYYHHKSYKYNFNVETEGNTKMIGYYYNLEKLIHFNNSIESEITDTFEDLCKNIYKQLEKDYEYLTSEKAILETIETNGYEFNENGEII